MPEGQSDDELCVRGARSAAPLPGVLVNVFRHFARTSHHVWTLGAVLALGCGGTGEDDDGGASGTGGAGTGECAVACGVGQVCVAGQCVLGTGTGGIGSGTGGGATGTGATETGGAATGGGGTGGSAGGCESGTTGTTWATDCPTSPTTCTAGTWVPAGSNVGYTFRYESEHFAFYWNDGTNMTVQSAQTAAQTLESIWDQYFGAPMFMTEPYCNQTTKYKNSVNIANDNGLTGGSWDGKMGMWVGPGAANDAWGLGHEFMHGVQSISGGLACGGPQNQNFCGWIYESHANFSPHQTSQYHDDVHYCSEMLGNAPHLYLGSTRDRYCNWQFMEFLKDKECYTAVNDIWTTKPAANDPFTKIMTSRGWSVAQLNDFLGDWAMHNVTWDYKESAEQFRDSYGKITDTSRPERRNRLTRLEPLGDDYASTRRFQSPYYWAPQRWGYNVVRLVPEAGATEVSVTFRGVIQSGADSDWRWGLVATDANLTTARYGTLQSGSDGQASLCITPGEELWLVVMGTPSVQQQIYWDKPYASIYRYPYMVELHGAWPDGYENGAPGACPSGTERHENGGGCAPSSLSASVYVGPNARVLGGTVSGSARIEDQATILSGATVSGGVVGGLSVLNRFTVSGTAEVRATFYPPGYFESGQGLSGTAKLLGDVEYRGQGLNKSSGSFSGFVDSGTASMSIDEVTTPPPYAWRP